MFLIHILLAFVQVLTTSLSVHIQPQIGYKQKLPTTALNIEKICVMNFAQIINYEKTRIDTLYL